MIDNLKEQLDIVNERDEVIGRAAYTDVYRESFLHRIVHVLIFNDQGELALQLRSMKKTFCPHHWDTTAGGHMHAGESYEEAILRECKEEIGIQPRMTFLAKDRYNGPGIFGPVQKFLVTFRAQYNGPFTLNTEVDDIRFFTLDAIRSMIERKEKFHPELLFLLEKHFHISV